MLARVWMGGVENLKVAHGNEYGKALYGHELGCLSESSG